MTIKQEDGTDALAAFIAPASSTESDNEIVELESLAYHEPDHARPELTDDILSAKERIIYSKSWAADGHKVYIEDMESGQLIKLPSFSELFPGWDMPAVDASRDSITEDGLGADLVYGMTAKVIEVSESSVICAPLCEINLFATDQLIEVFFDSFQQSGSPNLQSGVTVFVSNYGKDCDLENSIITAASISELNGRCCDDQLSEDVSLISII